MEISMIPEILNWIKNLTWQGMVLERAGGNEDPSRSRFSTIEEWRANFYRFPGYVLKSNVLKGYAFNGVPTNTEESESMGYRHGPQAVIECMRRDLPEVYRPLVDLHTSLSAHKPLEEGQPFRLVDDP